MAYELQEARELVIKAGLELLSSGLIARTWGNISARISDTQFVITPSGRAYEDLTPDQIVITNIADCSYEGDVKPSSEKWIHADAYRLRPNVNFVIHTHQSYASALSILGESITDIPEISGMRKLLGNEVPTAGYGLNGSKELSDNVSDAILLCPSSTALLMANHGAECMGTDYDNAFAIAHALEEVSKARYLSILHSSPAYSHILPSDEDIDTADRCGSNLHRYYFFVNPQQLQAVVPQLQTTDFPSVCASSGELDGNACAASDTFSADSKADSCASGFAAFSRAPFTVSASRLMQPELFPYIDDLAQIAGVSIRILPSDADGAAIQEALEGRNAVLLRGIGAICTGTTRDDVDAAVMVLEKGCRAALLAKVAGITREVRPLSPEHAATDRESYVTAYSKLMNR